MNVRIIQALARWGRPLQKASRAFAPDRLAYYESLADLLEDTGGRSNFLQIFMRDAQRYGNLPRGVLARHWAQTYEMSGASLAATWSGTLPHEEVSLMGVAEQGGVVAVITALRDLARVGSVIEASKREFVTTTVVGLVGVGISVGMLLAVPFFFVPFLNSAFGFVPVEFHGRATRAYFVMSDGVALVWPLMLGGIVAVLGWVRWALPNWTGPMRARIDEAWLLFKLYRDFKGSLFLAMFASLTKSRDGAATSQREALTLMQQGASPWLTWKIRAILGRIDEEGGLDATMLDVGVVDKSVYHLFADIFEARGVAAGLAVAGRRSEQRASATIAARSKMIRWVMLGGAVILMITLVSWLNVVVYEFKGAMVTYTNSR